MAMGYAPPPPPPPRTQDTRKIFDNSPAIMVKPAMLLAVVPPAVGRAT